MVGSTGELLSANMFVYCGNDPINRYDPSGYIWGFIKTFVAEISNAINTFKPLYATGGGLAIVDGLLPFGDLLGGVLFGVATLGVIAEAGYNSITNNTKKKPVNLPSFKKLTIDMDHIISGHTPNGNRNKDPKSKKDIFGGMSAEAIRRSIEEAYNVSTKIKTQGDRVFLKGVSQTYDKVIYMWVNIKDKIIETAYPR